MSPQGLIGSPTHSRSLTNLCSPWEWLCVGEKQVPYLRPKLSVMTDREKSRGLGRWGDASSGEECSPQPPSTQRRGGLTWKMLTWRKGWASRDLVTSMHSRADLGLWKPDTCTSSQ